jgi:hypothetical protein
VSVIIVNQRHLDELYALRKKVDQQIAAVETRVKQERSRRPRSYVAECGTDGGYYRHLRTIGERACDDCKRAHRDYERERARRAKSAA